MKKTILSGGLVALLGVYLGLTFFLGSIVKAGVNSFGPKLTQTKVELAGANILPFSGKGTLSGLAVGNPRGWSEGKAFYLGKIQIDVEPFSLFGDHIVINEITIDGPEFLYETRIFSSNIKDLLKNIERFTGRGEKAPVTKGGSPIKFVVRKFRLTNGQARLGAGAAALPLPPIALDDLGVKEGGITADQLAGVLMKQVLADIVSGTAQELAKDGGASAIEKTKEAAKQAGESLKKLFGKP